MTLLSGVFFSSTADATTLREAGVLQHPIEHPSAQGLLHHHGSAPLSEKHRQTLEYYGPWLTAKGYSSNAQELILSINDARVHGLNPEAYNLSAILKTASSIAQLSSANTPKTGGSSELTSAIAYYRVNFDKQLGEAFTALANDLGKGATKAQEVQRQMFRAAPKVNAQEWLNAISKGRITVSQALDSLMPHDQAYHRLTARMRELLAERNSHKTRINVEESEERAKEFVAHDIQRIKLRLIETGELPKNTELNSEWDGNVQYALQAFQQRSGIPVSGTADTRTRKSLNLTLDKEIEAVALSLERWRWMPRVLGRKHLLVNLPDYQVVVRKDEKTLLSLATVVGAAVHATPTFSEDLQHIVFNPTWTVPKSITNRELIPRERRKPGYLKSRNFDIMQRDGDYLVKVDYDDVTTEDLNADRFPYVLQQRSGDGNALGRMKFMMPNQWSIYMHDTQAKRLFTHNDRAYSHGCIRLSDPEIMARTLLHEDGYTAQEIDAALALTDRKLVRLRTPIPTHITYMTSWVDEYGTLNRRTDVYNHDEALISALKTNNTLLTILNQLPVISMVEGRVPNSS
ncbi:MAG: murein L,D-transpeptidase YcbB/YkuD [Gammaproteobacteria bacterium]|jgi:murein L,D-transpeptidase YcbB/YkuD